MARDHIMRHAAAIKAGQGFFRTVEVSFTPFIPFSKTWSMGVESQTGGFMMSPEGIGRGRTSPTQEMEDTMEGYENAGYDLMAQIDNMPSQVSSMLDTASTTMADELADILQGRNSESSKYETTHAAEIEERILIDWLLDSNNQMVGTGDERWKYGSFDGRRDVQKKGIGGPGTYISKEGIDMISKTENEQRITEYALHRLAANFGSSWVEGVQGIEMTKEVGKKYLQQVYARTDANLGEPDRFLRAAETMAEEIMAEYNRIVGPQGDSIVNAITSMGQLPSVSPENLQYITKQVLDRLADVTQRVGGTQASYIYHAPIVSRAPTGINQAGKVTLGASTPGRNIWLVGFAKFTPDITPGTAGGNVGDYRLNSIDVSVQVADLSAGPGSVVERAGWSIDTEELRDVMEMAGKTAYGTFSQWLMVDAAVNLFQSETQNSMMNDIITEGLGRWGDFDSQRGEMLGSHLWSNVGDISRGMLSGDIRAVDILSTKEITEGLERQFQEFFEPGGGFSNEAVERVYEDAVTASNNATDIWKGTLGLSNLSADANVWRRSSGLYDSGGLTGEGVGTPFYVQGGRNPTAFKKYKIRTAASEYIQKRHRPAVFKAGTQVNVIPLQGPGAAPGGSFFQGAIGGTEEFQAFGAVPLAEARVEQEEAFGQFLREEGMEEMERLAAAPPPSTQTGRRYNRDAYGRFIS